MHTYNIENNPQFKEIFFILNTLQSKNMQTIDDLPENDPLPIVKSSPGSDVSEDKLIINQIQREMLPTLKDDKSRNEGRAR